VARASRPCRTVPDTGETPVLLFNSAIAQHHALIAALGGFGGMRGHHDGQTKFTPQFVQQIENDPAGVGVEVSRGFIRQQ